MTTYPDVEESLAHLRRAGWSPVEESWAYPHHGRRYRVVVGRAGRTLFGEGKTVKEAWWRTCREALDGQTPEA